MGGAVPGTCRGPGRGIHPLAIYQGGKGCFFDFFIPRACVVGGSHGLG